MFNVAVCDDNIEEGQNIMSMARQILFDRNIDAEFSFFANPSNLLSSLKSNKKFDLLLLDVLFNKTNGIKIAQEIRETGNRTPLIYITVSRDYAIDGYKVQASDYLVKPVNKEALAESIGRIFREQDSLFIEADGTLKNFRYADIEYVEASANYVVMKVAGSDKTTRLRATLSETLKKLGNDRFARCHKGYLVNLGHIHEVRTNHIVLHNGDTVPLGRQYRTELQKNILEYIEKAIPR